MPILDGVKTVSECLNNGIEQAKDDIRYAKEHSNKERFDVGNSDIETQGVTVSYDANLFRGDDAK